MKACVIPIGLLAAILGFSLWAGRYVEVRTDHWIALLETADEAAAAENWREAEAQLQGKRRLRWSGGYPGTALRRYPDTPLQQSL